MINSEMTMVGINAKLYKNTPREMDDAKEVGWGREYRRELQK